MFDLNGIVHEVTKLWALFVNDKCLSKIAWTDFVGLLLIFSCAPFIPWHFSSTMAVSWFALSSIELLAVTCPPLRILVKQPA
jgi:hypothetical protein